MQPILNINLSTGETTEYEIPKNWEHDYLGSASLAARLLYAQLRADLDPVSPESPLLFLNGPLSGWPGRERLETLGLEDVTRDLWGQ